MLISTGVVKDFLSSLNRLPAPPYHNMHKGWGGLLLHAPLLHCSLLEIVTLKCDLFNSNTAAEEFLEQTEERKEERESEYVGLVYVHTSVIFLISAAQFSMYHGQVMSSSLPTFKL